MKISGQLNGVKVARTQFTAHDRELFPECDNAEYLEYENVSTGLSAEICSYGYQKINNGKIEWVKRKDLK